MKATRLKKAFKLFVFLLSVLFVLFLFNCTPEKTHKEDKQVVFTSYRNIPGITQDEINAIELLRVKYDSFNYTMLANTEAFFDINGEVKGYITYISRWLSDLFNIEFIPVIEDSWDEFLDGLESGRINFTGDLTATPERRQTYYMTDAIAHRSLTYFKLANSPSISEIRKTRLPKFVLLEGTTIAQDVLHYLNEDFEPVFVSDFSDNYELLKAGKADAVITENTTEAFYEQYGDVVTEDLYPLIYSPVSLTTKTPELKPIISVVQKALDNGAFDYLTFLYNKGNKDYLRNKLYLRLTEEEQQYIKDNPVIPFGAEIHNYPVSFYNTHFKEWQGICFDVLYEVEELTGLKFKVAHDENVTWSVLLKMLEEGEVSLISELLKTPDRIDRFCWPNTIYYTDYSALISKSDRRYVNVNEVLSLKVGLIKGSAHTDYFNKWFPNHNNTAELDRFEDAINALTKNQIDMVMGSHTTLLYLTNYHELPDFKINVKFDNSFTSTFGFNKNEEILCSIVDKSMQLINTESISEEWMNKNYDYRLKLAQVQVPWAIGSAVLLLILFVFMTIMNFKNKQKTKTIAEQSAALALERQLTVNYKYANKLRDALSNITKSSALSAGILKDAADVIAKEGCIALNTYRIGIWRTTEDTEYLKNITSYNSDNKYELNRDFDLMPHKQFANLLKTERLIVTNNINNSVFSLSHICNYNSELCALLDAPIRIDGKLAGVVCIEQNKCEKYPEGREWTIEEQNFASSLADLMAVAISGEERLKARDAAERANKAKSNFLANMSHEIRTPMNAIMGITEILLHDDNLPKNVSEGLGKIYNSCDLLLGIINDILDFSKIEAGKLDIAPAEYKIASLINDSVHLNLMRIDNKPIVFELEIDENIPAKLIGDELRIKQIFNNLLSNAFKYTDKGKIVLAVYCEPYTEGVLLVIRVQDTGPGMTREQIEKLFTEYYRFVNKTNIEGTGLGLAITRRLVFLMDGEIHVDSEPNKGSLFTVYLPQGTVDNEVIGKEVVHNLSQFRQSYAIQKTRTKIIRDPMPYGSVLIVDDVETNIDVAQGLMNLYNLKIDTVMSGQAAIDKIKAGTVYDIVFMDHMMPEMDGIEATQFLRNLGYTQPIVALTANAVAGQAELFIQNGFDDFISKPINIRQLNAVLNKLIRDKQPPEVVQAARAAYAAHSEQAEHNADISENAYLKNNPQLKASFIRDAKKTVELFENILKMDGLKTEDTMRRFVIAIHGMKSSLWNIGERELSEKAKKMEERARDGDTDLGKIDIPDFLKGLNSVLYKLLDKDDQEDAVENINEIRAALINIKEICVDYDRKSVLDILNKIEIYTKESKEIIDKIKEHVLHSEFEEAGSIAASYARVLGELC